jgi:predicted transcriptional regulator
MTGRQPADWALMERRNIAGTSLGGLEAELLEHLWAAGEPLGTRELAGMLPGPPRAYTTIVTVLTRLVGKGLVERIGDGRRYLYRPAGDPDQLTARAIERLLAAAADRRAVLAHLVEGSQDPGLLAELAALINDSDRESHGEGRP